MSLNKKATTKIINYFSKKPEVVAVYLYGSQARNDADDTSDIDLAVYVTDKSKYTSFSTARMVFSQDLSKILNKKVEVQDLDSASVDFAHRVLSEGRLLISNDNIVRITFEEKVIRVYFDLKPSMDEYYKYLSEIAKKGELHVRYT